MKIKIFSSRFIGKQLSRLKMGQAYYLIAVNTINAISLITIAFALDMWILVLLFPILLIGSFIVGYYMDVKNVVSQDYNKTNEMAYRFLLTSDIKLQQFQLLLIKVVLKSLQDIKDNKNINFDYLMEEYKKYQKDWEPTNL